MSLHSVFMPLFLHFLYNYSETLSGFHRNVNFYRKLLINSFSKCISKCILIKLSHIFLNELIAFKILTGKPTGKRSLGRPRHRWEDNIRMDIEEIGINAGNWIRILGEPL